MSFLQKLRRPESTVGLIIATLFWIPFQAVLFTPISLDAVLKVVNSQEYSKIFSYNPIVFATYVILPIVYCSIVSLLFKPKRMVSALYVQVGAFVLAYSAMFATATPTSPLSPSYIFALEVIFGIFAAIAIPVGLIQTFIVRLVIGLDYDEENVQQVTYSCNANFEVLTEKVLDSAFLKRWKFTTMRDDDVIKIYKWSLKASRTASNNVVLAIAPDCTKKEDENGDKSALSFVVYRKTLNYVTGSKDDLALVEDFCKIIRERLFDVKVTYDLTEAKTTVGLEVSKLAKLYAKQPTKSMFGVAKEPIVEVWRTSHYHAYAIASFIGIIAILTVAFDLRLGNIDSNSYLNIIVLVVLVFLAELGVSLRELLERRPQKSTMTKGSQKP